MAGEDGKMNWTMKKIYVFLISILISCPALSSQESRILYDEKVSELCSWVDALKESSDSYDEVRREMAGKMYWRLMEEYYENCSDVEAMCSLWDEVDKTGINDTAFQAEKDRGTKPQSTDNFCAGDETRYHYSLYECSLLSGKCVSSLLGLRSGGQLFLIIPYNEGSISARVLLNGTEIGISSSQVMEGCLEFYVEAGINDKIRVDVNNESSDNQSFVLINHNSGK